MLKYYCCPKKDAKEFENCAWYGKPGSCFDDHCPVGSHSVQLTDSPYGLGEDCFPQVSRTRVFCCDPVNGASPVLPVPLENLFPDPPTGDDVDTDHELNTDDTSDDPDKTAFSFVVLTSPEDLQVSLDKRDGSHWELFNCTDTDSEAEQTIQMVCTDVSENSNCHKIGLGHGVPGTILQMPEGCGPGKYAVAKEMRPAKEQVVPRGLLDRIRHEPVVYDLTFDYDFKRSMADVGHNHKRWLEEEFRDDAHFGGLETEEFHKRWFGETILEWLKTMTKGEIKKTYKHKLDDTYTAKIVEEKWECPGRDGYLLAQAQANIQVGTSFGFSLVASDLFSLSLDNAYLTFSNEGEITCIFTLEALVRFQYDSEERKLGEPIPFPGAGIRIPGIATIGPQLALRGRIEAGVTLSASLEAKLDVVSWEYEYRLPAEMDPSNPDKADYGDTGDKNGLLEPTFYAGVLAQGNAKAHLIAALEFGVEFDERWSVAPLTAQVVADSWLEVKVGAGVSTVASCPFTWGMDAGVDLYAKAQGFKWQTGRYALPGSAKFTIYKGGTCPDLTQGNPSRRRSISDGSTTIPSLAYSNLAGMEPLADLDDLPALDGRDDVRVSSLDVLAPRSLQKRAIGPFFKIPFGSLMCPNSEQGESSKKPCESISGWEDDQLNGALRRRGLPRLSGNGTRDEDSSDDDDDDSHLVSIQRRATSGRTVTFCKAKKSGQILTAPTYEASSTLGSVSNMMTHKAMMRKKEEG